MRMRSMSTWLLIIAVAAGTWYLRGNEEANEERGGGRAETPLVVVEPGPNGEAVTVAGDAGAEAKPPAAAAERAAHPSEPAGPEPALVQAAVKAGDEAHVALALLALVRKHGQDEIAQAARRRLGVIEQGALERAEAARGKDAAAERAALSVAYLANFDAQERRVLRKRLETLTRTVIFSRNPSVECVSYKVAPGDSLSRIARRHRFPIDGIMRINHRSRTLIRVGERLKIPRGPFEVVVFKGEYRLIVLQDGKWLAEYPIGTGRDDSTPEAEFTIVEKTKNPTWYAPDGVYPFGHPKNILGTRWLGFNDDETYSGFGIHGTAKPESIGRSESSGCIRMRNEDVEELYGLVPTGSRVLILP